MVLLLEDVINSHTLRLDALIELAVHHAVLAFLVNEVLYLVLKIGVGDLIAKIADASDEKALTLRE